MTNDHPHVENVFIEIGQSVIERGAPADLVATHLTTAGVGLWFAMFGAEVTATMLEGLAAQLRADPSSAAEELFARSTAPTQ